MQKRILSALAASLLALAACNNNDNGFKANNAASTEAPAQSAAPAAPVAEDDAAAAGKAFLAENQGKEGVQTTASGLQYKVNQEGSGKQPTAEDVVSVHYEGRLIDGTVFDASRKHGDQPITFPLNGVIPGWTEGVQLMKEGANYTFFIPAELAYGEHGVPGAIPPNSTLVFDVELVKVGE
ncbi:FKBP-type peptidyl-prolyl cis-trans isomerase [Neisseria sp. HSC-16F19]|nr:FKBP-type peptidyl-prolyl cis-trans isomerase [Neisseria sp. HSC-16F19]MCP2040484.1 FKBP-type peptidyl-prolyl cis-trans isomerase [Neisseria sp. HSC-16F19]